MIDDTQFAPDLPPMSDGSVWRDRNAHLIGTFLVLGLSACQTTSGDDTWRKFNENQHPRAAGHL